MKETFNLPDLSLAKKRDQKETIIDREGLNLPDPIKTLGKDRRYYLQNYGCQANFHDGEIFAGILEEMGYQVTDQVSNADLIILNTCAIRENAEDKVFGNIGELKILKKNNPGLIIAIGGCMMQEPSSVKRVYDKYPQIDLIFGVHQITKLPYLLYEVTKSKERMIEVTSEQGVIVENLPMHRDHQYKAFVSIMDGCNNFCTYCIVPYTRGKQRSRLMKDILEEVDQLAKQGYKEITLLGQNVNSYGLDLPGGEDFATLLREVSKTNISRIRFMTSNPWDFSDQIVEAVGSSDKIMPFIHLPVQSGSDRILKLMGRHHTKDDYLRLFNKLKKVKPNAAFSTDLIVGFPGETEEDFQATLDLYDQCQFNSAYTFAYSPRVGTPASEFTAQISPEVKKDRLARLNKKASYWAKYQRSKYLGTTVEVLAEGPSKRNSKIWSGYTPQMDLVNFIPLDPRPGDLVNVQISEVKSWTLDGKQV